jgi:hypothetical protein
MGNNPVSHIDPDGGYETWLGAFFGWVGSGFRGGINSNPNAEKANFRYTVNDSGYDQNGPWVWRKTGREGSGVFAGSGGMGIFRTPDRAAINFAKLYNDNSIRDKKEYGAIIYRVDLPSGNNYYTYGTPNVSSSEDGVFPMPDFSIKNATIVAGVHTHSNYDKRFRNDDFSPADIRGANFFGMNAYVAAPNGELLKYDVNTLMTTRIHKSIPSDSTHPRRVNNLNSGMFPKNERTR